MIRIDRGERQRRNFLRVLEEDVAVQVAIVRRRAPLVGGEGRELARLVVLVGDVHDSASTPSRPRQGSINSLIGSVMIEVARKR